MATSPVRAIMPPRKRAKANTPRTVKRDSVFYSGSDWRYVRTAADKLEMALRIHMARRYLERKQKVPKFFQAAVAELAGKPITDNISAWEWLLEDYLQTDIELRFAGFDNAVLAMRRGFKRVRREIAEQIAAAEARAAALAAQQIPGAEFYQSLAWRELRYRVLTKSKGCCEACRRTARDHGVALHVDHIMPRSQFPDLALEETNLQVLCDDCNIGKGTSDTTDWRASSTG